MAALSLRNRAETSRQILGVVFGSIAAALFIAALDLVTGSRLSVVVLYLAPIFFATWPVDLEMSPELAAILDIAEKLAFFCVFLLVTENLRQAFFRESKLARIDGRTGLGNRLEWLERLSVRLGESGESFSCVFLRIPEYDDTIDPAIKYG